jgi:hypothetical protein
MVVKDELARLIPGIGEPEPIHHVVQPSLEENEQVRTGDSLLLVRLFEVPAELLFEIP